MSAPKAKIGTPPVSYDVQRDRILRFLYERHTTARGPAKIPIGIRDLQSEMKRTHGMTQQEVSRLISITWFKLAGSVRSLRNVLSLQLAEWN